VNITWSRYIVRATSVFHSLGLQTYVGQFIAVTATDPQGLGLQCLELPETIQRTIQRIIVMILSSVFCNELPLTMFARVVGLTRCQCAKSDIG
jgi:hypothetical protein